MCYETETKQSKTREGAETPRDKSANSVYLIVALAQMGSYLKLIEEKTMMKINPANYEGMLKDFPGYLSRRFVPDLTKKFIRNHGAITYC